MVKVAVIAHSGKSFAGGLSELHGALVEAGIVDPLWYEVPKSRKAPKRVRKALKEGAELLFVWGGDGMVQRCLDAVANSPHGSKTVVSILPAGTANLLATHLGIPKDIPACVDIGLKGARRKLDVGKVNGERFAVMAGVGLDALMIREADKGLKARIGRLAYVWTGAKALDAPHFGVRVKVDGKPWFKGRVACVLLGNVGDLFGGVTVFKDARPDDGRLEVGVVTAKGITEWARTLAKAATGDPESSPFVETTSGKTIRIRLDRPVAYELDGSARPARNNLRVKVQPAAVTVGVAEETTAAPAASRSARARPAKRAARPRARNAAARGLVDQGQVAPSARPTRQS